MENAMINSYMQVVSGGQRLKEKVVQALRQAEDEYNGITWTTVALAALLLLAVVVVVAAMIWCKNRGFRGGSEVDWTRFFGII